MACVAYRKMCMESDRRLHITLLAEAVSAYYDEHGGLPMRFSDLETWGMFGSQAYRGPTECGAYNPGPAPHYLPYRDANQTGYVVAVESVRGKTDWLGYVVLGDSRGHYGSVGEVYAILRRDDEVREKRGEVSRWASEISQGK